MSTSLTRTMAFMVDDALFLKYRRLRGTGKLSTSFMADKLRETFAQVLDGIDRQRLKDIVEKNQAPVAEIRNLDAPT